MKRHVLSGIVGALLATVGSWGTAFGDPVVINHDTSDQFMATVNGPDGTSTVRIVRVPGSLALSDSIVMYSVNGKMNLMANVVVPTAHELTVAGTIGAMSYSTNASLAGDGTVGLSYSLGNESLAVSVPPTGLDLADTRVVTRYKNSVPSQQQAIVSELQDVLRRVEDLKPIHPEMLTVAWLASGAPTAEGGMTPAGAIDDFYQCQKDACEESGLCWNVQNTFACGICEDTEWYFVPFMVSLYNAAATACILTTPVCQLLPCGRS